MIDLLSVTSMSGRPDAGVQARSGDFSRALEKATPKGAESTKDAAHLQGSGKQDGQASDRTDSKAWDIGAVAADGEAHGETSVGSPSAPLVASLERVLSARIFGLHAQASGYLSELALSGPFHEALAKPLQRDEARADSWNASAGSDAPVETPSAKVLGSEDMAGNAMPVDSRVAMRFSEAADDAAPAPASMPDAAGDAVAWQERSLRVTHRLDGKHVIWLRDYTLSPDQARQLAQELVRHGQAQGVSLHSILWNGHEIWPSTGNEQGE
jgi:hypothetical protein